MAQVVGVDIGTSAVRAAEVEIGGGTPTLLRFGQVGLPPGVVVDGEVVDRAAVADALRRLWKSAELSSTTVVLGVAGLRAITRELELPWVPDGEVEAAIRFQAEEIVPFPAEQTVLSAKVVGEAKAEDGSRVRRVLVAACHRELVNGVVGPAEEAGLRVSSVDLVPAALLRALVDSTHPLGQPEAVVSVGAGLTLVVVHDAGVPQFVRTVPLGGNQATAAIASALDLPMADAEAVKRRLGEPWPQALAAEQAVQGALGDLVQEVRSSLEYAASLPGRQPVARVVLTGGGSRLRGLQERLHLALGVPVQPVSALARLDVSALELSPEQAWSVDPVLAAPIGLALPPPPGTIGAFNLLPGEVLARARIRRVTRAVSLGAVAAAVVVLGLGGWRTYEAHRTSEQVAALRSEIAQLNAEKPRYSKAQAVADGLAVAQREVEGLTTHVPDWYAVVQALAAQNPDNLAVTDFTGTALDASGSAAATQSSAAPGATTTSTLPGQIATIQATVTGTYQGNVSCNPYADFIGDVGKPFFGAPASAGPTCPSSGGQTVVTFSASIPVLRPASLSTNGCYDVLHPAAGCPTDTATKGNG
ncbi:type IV pilus assembly protein PilM [Aciditerrimonas ferrireducens]|jgi:type IV pilus assembly protein PilM|uniref:Type IV pilus assembly protein PilM n=2 Tax=Aciditerrimonas ferrireducens TaxID=667306 RepID=A0ABV6C3A1_9ACTN